MDFRPYEKLAGFKALKASAEGRKFLAKFKKDRMADEDLRKLFLKNLSLFKPGKRADIVLFCQKIMRKPGFKRKGPRFSGGAGADFLRIRSIEDFKGRIKEIIPPSATKTSPLIDLVLTPGIPDSVRTATFNKLLNLQVKGEIKVSNLAKKYFGTMAFKGGEPCLRAAKTSKWIEWSSHISPTEKNIFSSRKIKWLDCRSGLSTIKDKDKIVYFQKLLPGITVHKPTIFDAEFYPQFEPGGKTIPLKECESLGGFEEYVHPANFFGNIAVPLKFIRK